LTFVWESEFPGRSDLTPDALRKFAHEAVDFAIDYLSGFGDGRIQPAEAPAVIFERFRTGLPEEGSSPAAVLQEFRETVVRYATHLQHPGNLGYIPNSAGVVPIVADLLASTLNQNVSLVRGGASAAAIEAEVVRWLKSLLGFPEEGGGVLTSGGSIANVMGLALARERAGGGDGLVFYGSEETHSSIERGLKFLGFPRNALRRVACDREFRMSPSALEAAIESDRAARLRPAAVVATTGTIGTGAVDPLEEIAAICRAEKLWLHVDGAYGALAAAAPSGAFIRKGLARVDSLSLDPHKWLFVPVDTSCLLVRDVAAMRRFFTVVPEYLKVSPSEQDVPQPMEHTIELSRRFRALRIWMALKVYGARAIRARIEEHLTLARALGSFVEAEPDFELLAPVVTSTVVFRHVPPGETSPELLDQRNETILNRLNECPAIFLSRNRLGERFTLRACITHLRTKEEDVRRFWDLCREVSRALG
jgi:glutamate/tyrosine decarboxylase-like PLP-dependent enzyme